MSILLISIAIIGATLIWPLNRSVMRNGGRMEVYGFWVALTIAIVSGCVALTIGQSLFHLTVWRIGAAMGIASGIGYSLIIMYCLRIGPTGPTVAMNNMGMVWPVVLGAIWLKPHPINGWMIIGLGLTIFSLICFGLGKPGTNHQLQTSRISVSWAFWAFLGWVLSGISMTSQLIGSIYVPDSPFALIFASSTIGTIILALFVLRLRTTWFSRREMITGAITGPIQVIIGVATLSVLKYVGPEIVFPFTVVAPVVLVLILGQFVYREHLDRIGWVACLLSVLGLVSLSVGQTLL